MNFGIFVNAKTLYHSHSTKKTGILKRGKYQNTKFFKKIVAYLFGGTK